MRLFSLLPLLQLFSFSLNSAVTTATENSTYQQYRFAVCLTGQLVRLELGSKIKHLIRTNLLRGFHISLFVLLDNDEKEIKGAKAANRFDPTSSLYSHVSASDLTSVINELVSTLGPPIMNPNFKVYVRLEPPIQHDFPLYDQAVVPVRSLDKHKNDKQKFKAALARFQGHMRWQSSLRECVRWMQEIEFSEKKFYDFVMRLREDTFVVRDYFFSPNRYRGYLLTLKLNGVHDMVCDHNLIIDRSHADKLFRGLTEDYYLDSKSHGKYWGGPEELIKRLSEYHRIKILHKPICSFPFLPFLRPFNHTHWKVNGLTFNSEMVQYECIQMLRFLRNECSCVELDREEVQLASKYHNIAISKR